MWLREHPGLKARSASQAVGVIAPTLPIHYDLRMPVDAAGDWDMEVVVLVEETSLQGTFPIRVVDVCNQLGSGWRHIGRRASHTPCLWRLLIGACGLAERKVNYERKNLPAAVPIDSVDVAACRLRQRHGTARLAFSILT